MVSQGQFNKIVERRLIDLAKEVKCITDGLANITDGEPSLHPRIVEQRLREVKNHIVQFASARTDWVLSTIPCACGGNHYALSVTRKQVAAIVCPVCLYMRMINVILEKNGGAAVIEWAKQSPISAMINRIDERRDAFEDRLR